MRYTGVRFPPPPHTTTLVNVEESLPERLRGPATTITRIAAGLSGAGVYRVEADGELFVLKVSSPDEPLDAWRRTVHVRQIAADAGLAPHVMHVDEANRAVLSAFVLDRSFPMYYGDPRTRDAAIDLLGRTLRRVHDLPLPTGAEPKDARDYLGAVWAGLDGSFVVPGFVRETASRVLAESPPATDRATVLSHNDVNPTNLVYDGERILLLDWDTAGPNDPLYDLAAISVFMRMDEGTCLRLLAAHDGEPVNALPARFVYDRQLAAAMCGVMFLHLARQGGHAGAAGASGNDGHDSTPSLSEFYQRLRAGTVDIRTPDGQWAFGLALVKAAV